MSTPHDLQIWRAAIQTAISVAHNQEQRPHEPEDVNYESGMKWMQDAIVGNLYAIRERGPTSPLPPDPELASLREKVKALEEKLKLKDAIIADDCENETAIEKLCKPILGKAFVEGDSLGVPSIVDLVAKLIDELKMHREATRHRYDREGHDRGVMTSPQPRKDR